MRRKDKKTQATPAVAAPGPATAEIKLKRGGWTKQNYVFYVEEVSMFGVKEIAASRDFNCTKDVIDDDELHTRTGFMNSGKQQQRRDIQEKHLTPLVQSLIQMGFAPVQPTGEHWYSFRFQR